MTLITIQGLGGPPYRLRPFVNQVQSTWPPTAPLPPSHDVCEPFRGAQDPTLLVDQGLQTNSVPLRLAWLGLGNRVCLLAWEEGPWRSTPERLSGTRPRRLHHTPGWGPSLGHVLCPWLLQPRQRSFCSFLGPGVLSDPRNSSTIGTGSVLFVCVVVAVAGSLHEVPTLPGVCKELKRHR